MLHGVAGSHQPDGDSSKGQGLNVPEIENLRRLDSCDEPIYIAPLGKPRLYPIPMSLCTAIDRTAAEFLENQCDAETTKPLLGILFRQERSCSPKAGEGEVMTKRTRRALVGAVL